VSKAAILSAGAGVSVAAISNEIYVVNEETIVAFCLLTVMWGAFRYLGPSYVSWADSQRKKLGDLLNAARDNHTESVKERISTVNELSGVVDVTKSLFELSKVRTRASAGVLTVAGNRQAGGRGVPAGAEDGDCGRGQGGAGLVGAVRGPGEAEAAAGAGRQHHCADREGAAEPQGAEADSGSGCSGCRE
jgi:hypothetical protein